MLDKIIAKESCQHQADALKLMQNRAYIINVSKLYNNLLNTSGFATTKATTHVVVSVRYPITY